MPTPTYKAKIPAPLLGIRLPETIEIETEVHIGTDGQLWVHTTKRGQVTVAKSGEEAVQFFNKYIHDNQTHPFKEFVIASLATKSGKYNYYDKSG